MLAVNEEFQQLYAERMGSNKDLGAGNDDSDA